MNLRILALSMVLLLSLTGCGTRTGRDSASSASPAISSAAAGASATAGAASSGAASRMEPSDEAAASTPDIPDASDASGSVDAPDAPKSSDTPESSESPGERPDPDASDTSGSVDTSGTPESSDAPESSENPGGHPEGAAAAASTADASGSAGQAELPETQEAASDNLFAEAAGEYLFSSGAGAWGTALTLSPDGSFTGSFHDSDMGDQGDGYPNGTVYVCAFSGAFAPAEKIDGYTWSTRLESLEYDPPDTETIEDGVRYVTAEPFGLAGAEEIRIYLPGAPLDALPEGFLNWAAMFLYGYEGDTLPVCGIYNVTGETAFVQDIYGE